MSAIGSGVLLSASFPPSPAYGLIFIALVPLVARCHRSTPSRAAIVGWCTGVVFYGVAWHWVAPAIARFQEISIFAALPLFGLFSAWHALQLALFAAGAAVVLAPGRQRCALTCALAAASWWVVLEWSFPRIIPYYLADALAPAPLLRQAADVGGVYGLSFAIVLANVWLAEALSPAMSSAGRRARYFLCATATVIVPAAYGATKSPQVSRDADLLVSIVQGVVPSGSGDVARANEDAWKTYHHLTSSRVDASPQEVDLVIWPETTLRAYLHHDRTYTRRIRDLVRTTGLPLLVGALDLRSDLKGEYNAAFLFTPHRSEAKRPSQIYRKRRLLWFAETVPAGLPWRTTGNFIEGDGTSATIMNLPTQSKTSIAISPSICFEAISAGAYNTAVRSGAAVLVNITDDGWFANSAEPYQHLNATILRAVETRRWLVRASNSGISAFIDPTGNITASLPFGEIGVLTSTVDPGDEVTLYVRAGDWPVGLPILMLGFVALMRANSRRQLQ